MSDNELVKAITDAATLTGLVAGIAWIAKKVVKETFTADPSDELCEVHGSDGREYCPEAVP